jgi:extracellular factor (EF) 3-hydroxypalmitic acid methyl ester biosynthesis protein
MAQVAPVYEGWLTAGGAQVPIKARYASRYSLYVETDAAPADELENCTLHVDDRLFEIGPCRLLVEQAEEGPRRRLVALRKIFDFEKLFFHSKVDTIETAFLNLSLVLGYKRSIDPAFRSYVSDLTYDLNVYSHQLDQVDAESRDETPAVREVILGNIIARVGAELDAYMDGQRKELSRIVAGYSRDEHEHHGFYFRRQLWNILLRAPIMARTNLKPRGYNGDSEMMRMIYLNDYQGESTFGKILHKYSVAQAAAQAVRNRRGEVAQLLHQYAVSHAAASSERLKILSVACGPAFEVRDIVRTAHDCARMHFSLFDQDQQALLEAAGSIGEIEKELHAEISVDFIKESVRTMLVTRGLKDRWGQFHFIYSMGLFDYLTAPVAAAVLGKLYQLLTPGGEMAIGNFFVENPSRYFMEYWHDWRIIYRTEEDFLQIAEGLPGAEVSVRFDQTRIQMLLHVRKLVADD